MKENMERILDIYKEVKKILDSHHLQHFLAFGTAIGAVRHHGFIPWDDDLDILIPRADYDKMWAILDRELPKHLKTLTWRNTKEWTSNFGKVMETRKEVVDSIENKYKSPLPQGLYIDLFPLDGLTNNRLLLLFYKIRSQCAYMRYTYLCRRNELHKTSSKVVYLIGAMLWPFFHSMANRKDYCELRERWARSRPLEKSKFCGWIAADPCHWTRWVIPATCFKSTELMSFCDIEAPVPSGYDLMLRIVYGDYMKLPPEEKRHPEHNRCAPMPWRLGPTGA